MVHRSWRAVKLTLFYLQKMIRHLHSDDKPIENIHRLFFYRLWALQFLNPKPPSLFPTVFFSINERCLTKGKDGRREGGLIQIKGTFFFRKHQE
jgi:hypothetical protein